MTAATPERCYAEVCPYLPRGLRVLAAREGNQAMHRDEQARLERAHEQLLSDEIKREVLAELERARAAVQIQADIRDGWRTQEQRRWLEQEAERLRRERLLASAEANEKRLAEANEALVALRKEVDGMRGALVDWQGEPTTRAKIVAALEALERALGGSGKPTPV